MIKLKENQVIYRVYIGKKTVTCFITYAMAYRYLLLAIQDICKDTKGSRFIGTLVKSYLNNSQNDSIRKELLYCINSKSVCSPDDVYSESKGKFIAKKRIKRNIYRLANRIVNKVVLGALDLNNYEHISD